MVHRKILVLCGDGIGPEVTKQAVKVLDCMNACSPDLSITCHYGLIGGIAVDKEGSPLSSSTLELAKTSSAILLGAVGAPQYEKLERSLRPERGLLQIRRQFELFANIRPARAFSASIASSSLKERFVSNLDILIVRELTGGIYFGDPRGIEKDAQGVRFAYNTARYCEKEVERIAHVAFKMAMDRNKRLCSVDKANVLEVSELWREVVNTVSKKYPSVRVTHLYVDNAAMQLALEPKQFDVILASNMFGDILSDLAAALSGSIGLLPSASLGKSTFGLYEPIHGSAPDIAGKGIANPIASILSLAMLMRYTFALDAQAAWLEQAVQKTLLTHKTADLDQKNPVSTEEMGDAIVQNYKHFYT